MTQRQPAVRNNAPVAVNETKERQIVDWLNRNKGSIRLPKGMDVDRLKFQTMVAIKKSPRILDCDYTSILNAVLQIATYGLYPGPLAHLVPFKNECVPILDYKGLVQLVLRAGVRKVESRVVRDGDEFRYSFGTTPSIVHNPKGPSTRAMSHVYAIAWLENGETQFEVMDKAEIAAIKDRSPSVRNNRPSPWDTDPDEMSKKTVLRRLTKPMTKESPELETAVEFEERLETGSGRYELSAVEIDPSTAQIAADVDRASGPLDKGRVQEGINDLYSDGGATASQAVEDAPTVGLTAEQKGYADFWGEVFNEFKIGKKIAMQRLGVAKQEDIKDFEAAKAALRKWTA